MSDNKVDDIFSRAAESSFIQNAMSAGGLTLDTMQTASYQRVLRDSHFSNAVAANEMNNFFMNNLRNASWAPKTAAGAAGTEMLYRTLAGSDMLQRQLGAPIEAWNQQMQNYSSAANMGPNIAVRPDGSSFIPRTTDEYKMLNEQRQFYRQSVNEAVTRAGASTIGDTMRKTSPVQRDILAGLGLTDDTRLDQVLTPYEQAQAATQGTLMHRRNIANGTAYNAVVDDMRSRNINISDKAQAKLQDVIRMGAVSGNVNEDSLKDVLKTSGVGESELKQALEQLTTAVKAQTSVQASVQRATQNMAVISRVAASTGQTATELANSYGIQDIASISDSVINNVANKEIGVAKLSTALYADPAKLSREINANAAALGSQWASRGSVAGNFTDASSIGQIGAKDVATNYGVLRGTWELNNIDADPLKKGRIADTAARMLQEDANSPVSNAAKLGALALHSGKFDDAKKAQITDLLSTLRGGDPNAKAQASLQLNSLLTGSNTLVSAADVTQFSKDYDLTQDQQLRASQEVSGLTTEERRSSLNRRTHLQALGIQRGQLDRVNSRLGGGARISGRLKKEDVGAVKSALAQVLKEDSSLSDSRRAELMEELNGADTLSALRDVGKTFGVSGDVADAERRALSGKIGKGMDTAKEHGDKIAMLRYEARKAARRGDSETASRYRELARGLSKGDAAALASFNSDKELAAKANRHDRMDGNTGAKDLAAAAGNPVELAKRRLHHEKEILEAGKGAGESNVDNLRFGSNTVVRREGPVDTKKVVGDLADGKLTPALQEVAKGMGAVSVKDVKLPTSKEDGAAQQRQVEATADRGSESNPVNVRLIDDKTRSPQAPSDANNNNKANE